MNHPCRVIRHGHAAVVARDEIFIWPEFDGGQRPIAMQAAIRLFHKDSVDVELALAERDGFLGEREDALEVEGLATSATNDDDGSSMRMSLRIHPPAGAEVPGSIAEGGFHAASAHDDWMEPDPENEECEQG